MAVWDNDIASTLSRVQALLNLTESISDSGSWELDREGRFTYWSEQMYTMHGYTIENGPPTVETWLQTITEKDRNRLSAKFDKILAGNLKELSTVYSWDNSNSNHRRNFKLYLEPINANKQVVGIRGIAHDITSEIDALEKLQQNEKRFTNIFRSIPAPIAIWNKNHDQFVLAEINDSLLGMSEGLAAKIVGTSAQELYQNRPDIIEDLKICYETKTAIERDVKYKSTITGTTRDFRTSFIYVDGQVLVFSEDVTFRKQAEQTLRESERQYRELFDNSLEGLCVLDKEHRIEDANSALLNALGYDLQDIKDVHFIDLVDNEYRSRAGEYISGSLGSVIPRELTLIKSNGSQMNVLVSVRSISGTDGSLSSSLVEITDITRLKEAESRLAGLRIQLEQQHGETAKKEAALAAVLTHLETDKLEYQKRTHRRLYRAIGPYLDRLRSHEGRLSESEIREMEEAILVSLKHDVDEFEINKSKLSPQERLISEKIAVGMTSKEISDKMYLSVETVRKHRKSIRRKLKLTHKGANLTTYLRLRLPKKEKRDK